MNVARARPIGQVFRVRLGSKVALSSCHAQQLVVCARYKTARVHDECAKVFTRLDYTAARSITTLVGKSYVFRVRRQLHFYRLLV